MILVCYIFVFFFSSRRRHTRCSRDWSSDVCSSDLHGLPHGAKASFDPSSMQNAGSSTLTVSLGKSIRGGKYRLTISGYSQNLTRRTSIVLTTVGQKPGSQTPDAEVDDD